MQRYKFQKEVDCWQLACEIEDLLKIQLAGYGSACCLEGQVWLRGKELEICIFGDDLPSDKSSYKYLRRILSAEEESILAQIVAAHSPKKEIYKGKMSNVLSRYSESICRISVTDKENGDSKFATGFLFEEFDQIMTAAHVIDPDEQIIEEIIFGSKKVELDKILFFDRTHDIALIKIKEKVLKSPFRIRQELDDNIYGMECLVLGFPNFPGTEPSSSFYPISIISVKKNYLKKEQYLLELSINLGSGCSGAPIINGLHSLIGMVIGYPSNEGESERHKWMSFAVPCDKIRETCSHDNFCRVKALFSG
jgi:S1-C subfamily serine protease